MNRRQFLGAAGVAISAPSILKFGRAMAQTPRVRRNLAALAPNDPFFTQYGEAIRAMHRLAQTDRRSWRGQAMIHADFCPHGTDGFIFWHRHYITFFERLCGSLIGNPNFTLPYWDWSSNNGRLPAAFSDANSPLNVAFWRDRSEHRGVQTVAIRAISATRGLMDDPARSGPFRPRQINAIMGQTNFSLFQGMLEGTPHNTAHTITGGNNGHMVDLMSPLDPIFWLHHCNVDRLTAQWQRSGRQVPQPNLAYSRQFVDPQGALQNVTAAQALDFAAMGFTYDVLAEQAVAAREERPAPPAPAAAPAAAPARRETPEENARPAQQGRAAGAESIPENSQRSARSRSGDYDGVIIDGREGEQSRRSRSGDYDGVVIEGTGEPKGGMQDHANHAAPQQDRSVNPAISVIGRSASAQPCSINRTTQISVSTESIFNDIILGPTRGRSLRSPPREEAGGERRILARLTVRQPQGEVRRCLVNVFLNASDVTPTTPADNPNYVGSFSFFGHHHVQQGGTFLVDVTEAVRAQATEGRLASGGVDLQVLPVLSDPNAQGQAQFVVDGVEMISG